MGKTVSDCVEVVLSIIGDIDLPDIDEEGSRAVREAIYTLGEQHEYFHLDFSTALDCWRLVEAARNGSLQDRLDDFRL